jgi:hypothetical protein
MTEIDHLPMVAVLLKSLIQKPVVDFLQEIRDFRKFQNELAAIENGDGIATSLSNANITERIGAAIKAWDALAHLGAHVNIIHDSMRMGPGGFVPEETT